MRRFLGLFIEEASSVFIRSFHFFLGFAAMFLFY